MRFWFPVFVICQIPREHSHSVLEGLCPIPDTAQLIGDKWKLIILQIVIFQGMKRFNQLKHQIDEIAQTMLTSQFRAPEKDGLVHKKGVS